MEFISEWYDGLVQSLASALNAAQKVPTEAAKDIPETSEIPGPRGTIDHDSSAIEAALRGKRKLPAPGKPKAK